MWRSSDKKAFKQDVWFSLCYLSFKIPGSSEFIFWINYNHTHMKGNIAFETSLLSEIQMQQIWNVTLCWHNFLFLRSGVKYRSDHEGSLTSNYGLCYPACQTFYVKESQKPSGSYFPPFFSVSWHKFADWINLICICVSSAFCCILAWLGSPLVSNETSNSWSFCTGSSRNLKSQLCFISYFLF